MDDLNFKDILDSKRPFLQITAKCPLSNQRFNSVSQAKDYGYDHAQWEVLTQEEMLRQYFPSGHKINNELFYPDIMKQDPETKKWYKQQITRVALGFQQIITTKHVIHLIGNDVQFELSDDEQKNVQKRNNEREKMAEIAKGNGEIFSLEEDESVKNLSIFKKGWLDLNMEMKMYEAVFSYMVTSECAMVGALSKNGEPCFRTFSYKEGSKLYPIHDSITGELELFARQYFDYDEDGNAITEWVEVWDEKYLYRAKRGTANAGMMTKIKNLIGLNGFEIVSKKEHGFSFIPVAYLRNDDGPCWSAAQDTIEKFEEAMSYFFENNKAFAFPIMVLTGDGVDIRGDENGAVKTILIDSEDGDAHFLQNNDVSTSYNTLLTKFYDLIYEQSFTVKPPELKSGDLPGVALKLLYSPAIERAIMDAQKMQPFLEKVIKMVKYAWGLKMNCQADLINLGINAWIEPYVHQNDTELTTNLATAVQNNFISKRTASERFSKYAKNDEYMRITREMKEKMLLNVQEKNLEQTHATDETIREKKIESELTNGQDINTGGGGNHINETDENGNRPNENNWSTWNRNRF